MASKKSLLGGVTVKVENRSGFDKSRYNAFTAPLGAIVPMVKQLVLPGNGKLSVKISAQLPPLATDAFLRSHLKVEAFLCPLRLCYGGWQSFFSGEPISSNSTAGPATTLKSAALPRASIYLGNSQEILRQVSLDWIFGPHSLMDYFGVKLPLSNGHVVANLPAGGSDTNTSMYFNIFPFLAYQLIYHHWYRNKLIQRPLFAPPASDIASQPRASYLPYVSLSVVRDYYLNACQTSVADMLNYTNNNSYLLNGNLFELRQRNYGFDYFTTALPSAQDGSPMSVSTSGNTFTISSLRMANALQEFAERNQVAGPDYVQVLRARYGKAPSNGVAQRPILLGSADFPMFTSGVEQTAQGTATNGNPFAGIAARYGRAHAEGSDFVCEFDCDEPSYLMVMCSLVPEANYSTGVPHDMTIFTSGSITDLPCSELEHIGMEPIFAQELEPDSGTWDTVFGYQPRFTWHKAGQPNEVHGLFREGSTLESFIPQRSFGGAVMALNDEFLKIAPTDLDNITAVSGQLSQYGVMIDSAISLFVSEPLGESVMPSLVDPAAEHGQSVYLKRGGVSVND